MATEGFVPVGSPPVPAFMIDNDQTGTNAGLPVMRQRTSEQNKMVPTAFDTVNLTYNADGTLATATYLLSAVTVATLTMGYTAGQLTSVVRT